MNGLFFCLPLPATRDRDHEWRLNRVKERKEMPQALTGLTLGGIC